MAKPPLTDQQRAKLLNELHRDVATRRHSYRERALALFPHVCARCARAFDGVRLKELTVHHKDHNHDNNPPDGSNWELLCLYCHDNEHSRYLEADRGAGLLSAEVAPATHNPFAALAGLIKKKD